MEEKTHSQSLQCPINNSTRFTRRSFLSGAIGVVSPLLVVFRGKGTASKSSAVQPAGNPCSLRIQVVESLTGQLIPCTIQIHTSRGKIITTNASFEDGFRSPGESSLDLPPGATRITVTRGFDHTGYRQDLTLVEGQVLDLKVVLKRHSPLRSLGWYCSDHHVHMIHGESTILVDFDYIALTARSEGLDALSVAQRWNLPDSSPQALDKVCQAHSSDELQLAWNMEAPKNYYRGNVSLCLGHCWTVGMKGYDSEGKSVIDELASLSAADYESEKKSSANFESHALIHAQGGIASYSHPCRWWKGDWGGKGIYPVESDKFVSNMAAELPFDTIAGPTFDGLDILMQPHEEEANRNAQQLWFLLLNHGYRLAGTASSDATFDNPGGGVPGRVRIYARLEGGLSLPKLAEAIKKGRIFVTSGPLLQFRMGEAEVGAICRINGPQKLKAKITAWSSGSPGEYLTAVEMIRNGEIVKRWDCTSRSASMTLEADLEERSNSWYIARCTGSSDKQVAITNPIYFEESNYQPPQPAPATAILSIREKQTDRPLSGTCEVLEMIGHRPRVLQSLRFDHGHLVLTVPATSRLRVYSEGYAPVEKSIFLDSPPLLDLALTLRVSDLLDWKTFERVQSLLKEVRLSFELEPAIA